MGNQVNADMLIGTGLGSAAQKGMKLYKEILDFYKNLESPYMSAAVVWTVYYMFIMNNHIAHIVGPYFKY